MDKNFLRHIMKQERGGGKKMLEDKINMLAPAHYASSDFHDDQLANVAEPSAKRPEIIRPPLFPRLHLNALNS